jgi:hypothetical protein
MRRFDHIRSFNRDELTEFVETAGDSLTEDEAVAILDNRFCSSHICLQIANSTRLTTFYSIRAKLVGHRSTPQGHALKYVHHLQWRDLLAYSIDTRVAPPIRRAVETQMLARLSKLSLGEKIASAKACSRGLIHELLYDADPKVFSAILINPRLTEEDLVAYIESGKAFPEHLAEIGGHSKWSFRYPIRRSLVMNTETPRAIAASQLRYLQRDDLARLLRSPNTSVYLRRCIERLSGGELSTSR